MGHPAVRQRPPGMTIEEFLAWEDGTDTRYELARGEVFAMTPPSVAHADILANLVIGIGTKLRRPCRVSTEVGIRCSEKENTFYQADLAISCSPRRAGERYLGEPHVLIEVLSSSTAGFDRGTKVPDYRSLPSVREVVLVFSTEWKAEVWQRNATGWDVADVSGVDGILRLVSVDVELSLAEIYEGVALESKTPAGETEDRNQSETL